MVQGLLRAKDPKKSRQARPFSKVVANHVLKNKAAILETADKIDRLFESNGAVSGLTAYLIVVADEAHAVYSAKR